MFEKLRRMWEEVVIACFKISQNLAVGIEETYKDP
jgi:hypothetical protein